MITTRPKTRRKTSTCCSLQHQGENALALARQLGRLDLDHTRRGDVIYTSILNRTVLYYPRSWAFLLALATAALYLVVAAIGLGSGRLRLVDLTAGVGVWLVAAVASIFAVGGFWVVLRGILRGVVLPGFISSWQS